MNIESKKEIEPEKSITVANYIRVITFQMVTVSTFSNWELVIALLKHATIVTSECTV